MVASLEFVKVDTNIKGLMSRATDEWNRYLSETSDSHHWVCVENPEVLARALEVLATDLPEEDLGLLVRRMPYLIVLFADEGAMNRIPFDSLFAFLSVLNRAGMVTLLRQSSDRHRLASYFGLDSERWKPLLFMMAGVPDIHAPLADEPHGQVLFF